MKIDIKNEDGAMMVALSGRLDTISAPLLQQTFDEMPEIPQGANVALDFSGVDYVSSAGFRVLLVLQKKITEAQGSLTIKNLSDAVLDVFEMTGFTSIFNITEDGTCR